MKRSLLFLFLVYGVMVTGQTTEPIEADRPDQTETPAIVPKGMFQFEVGFSYQKNKVNSTSLALPSALWKYGVNDNFELRLITEWVVDKELDTTTSGVNPILIGCKIKICEEKGIIPKTSFIGHMSIPKAASSKYKADFYAPEFRFTMQHTLSDKLSLGYNLGSEWDGFSAEPTFIYTLTTGYSINEKLGSYVEFFGFAPQEDKANHNFDAGITYLVNRNFMVDLSSGVGVTENAPDYYIAFGFSFRI
ncbi:transporter [Flavobacterium sp.]|uniref:transporter n=1 Tax=Flavobacterium sp. TaxID=239 RepID=UPI00286D0E7D|nr:transporter [Flavobacterium sp.]